MNKPADPANGIQLMIEKHRNNFRCTENTEFYSPDDYKEAERKYVKFCLNGSSKS